MARVEIFKVDTKEAVKNIGELRENIKALKAKLDDTSMTWEEQQKYVKQLAVNQAALRNAMHGSTASFSEITAAANASTVAFDKNGKLINEQAISYNALVRKLAELKEQWRATTNAAERSSVGEEINKINDRLKQMDASVGVFGRNVGNYIGAVDHLTAGLSAMGKGAAGMVNPLKNMTNGLKVLSTTPAIAVLGLLANLLTKVVDGLKSSEEGLEGATAAMGVFGGISTGITNIVQGLAKGLGWLATQFVNLLDKIGLVNDRMKENQSIAQEEIRIARQSRDAVMKNAEAERDIAELRAKAVDKQRYTTKERIAFLEQASVKEQEIAARARKAAKDEYELIKRKNAQTQSSAEALKAEADAYARMVQADTNYQQKVRQNTREINAARKEAAREAKEALKEQTDAAKARLEAEKEMLTQELSLLEKGSVERLNKQKELRQKEYEIAVQNARAKVKNEEDLAKQLTLLEDILTADLLKIDREYENDLVAQALQAERNRVEAMTKGSAAYLLAVIDLRQKEYDTLAKLDGESEADFQARRIAAFNALKEARTGYDEWEREQESLAWENRLAVMEDGSMEALAAQVALKEHELTTLHRLEEESEEAFRSRQIAAEKAYYQAKKAQRDAWVQQMQAAAGAVSGILGSIADMYEGNTDATEEEVRKAKNLRIAGATIDMLSGVVTAVSTAMQLGPIAGPIMAAVNSAAVIAAGVANIAKIRATDVNKNASPSGVQAAPAAVAPPSLQPQVTETRTITSASEEDRLNQMADPQRVYILSSDLEADRNAARVQVAETSW